MKVYTSKDKSKVLKRAIEDGQRKISLWKGPDGVWHAAHGPQHVPNWAVEVELLGGTDARISAAKRKETRL